MSNKTTWALDPTHSELQFKVKHMMIANVTGHFSKYDVNVETEGDDFSNAKINVTVDLTSTSTGQEQRDGHMQSADFFDTANTPNATFVSTKVEKADNSTYKVHGDLTIRNITKPIVLNAEFGGINKDPYGNMKAGFSITGKIARKDWGLNWNAPLETGGLLVSEDVRIVSEIQLVKK